MPPLPARSLAAGIRSRLDRRVVHNRLGALYRCDDPSADGDSMTDAEFDEFAEFNKRLGELLRNDPKLRQDIERSIVEDTKAEFVARRLVENPELEP